VESTHRAAGAQAFPGSSPQGRRRRIADHHRHRFGRNRFGGDNLIFEEFKSTGNAEFRLLRTMADRRLFPAVDIASTGTRKEEMLLASDELATVRRLRKALQALDPMQRSNSSRQTAEDRQQHRIPATACPPIAAVAARDTLQRLRVFRPCGP
jgi:hypothetical protein